MDTDTCLKLVGVHVQATEGTASKMNLGLSRCLRRKQYLTHGAGKVSAQEYVQEGAGSYHSRNREALKQFTGTD